MAKPRKQDEVGTTDPEGPWSLPRSTVPTWSMNRDLRNPGEAPGNLHISTDSKAALDLLLAWRRDDADEQRDTWECLQRVLNEDRLSDRRL